MNIDWRVLLAGAGSIIKQLASTAGPIASTVADFAVDAIEAAIDGALSGQDAIVIAQGVADKALDLVQKLKVDSAS